MTKNFFLLSGSVLALSQLGNNFEWLDVKSGEFVQIPGRSKHGAKHIQRTGCSTDHHNSETGDVLSGSGKTRHTGSPLTPPTPDDLKHFATVAAKYQHWLGSPEENAALDLLPK